MALEEDIRVLSGVRLFEGFTREQLRLLAFGAENLQVPAGREIYREGAEGDFAFIVTGGTVNLFRERGGERKTVGTAERGAIMGEFALIAPSVRLTGAVAETDVDLIRLNRTQFRRLLEEYPDTAIALRDRISRDLMTMLAEIETLAPRFAD